MRVLFIDIDTLRPDHMSCYGYLRKTTPNMDEIANTGVRFNRYYTSDAPCLPSRAALVTGMFGFRNGVVGHGGTAADRRLSGLKREFRDYVDDGCFHQIFRDAGMHTVSVSTFPERHSAWWFQAGFNETSNVGKGGMESGEEVLPIALDWLQRKGKEDNWFFHVHFWDPHTPYRAPAEFGEPFQNEPIESWLTDEVFEQHKKHTGPHSVMETGMFTDRISPQFTRQPGMCDTKEKMKKLMDGYDTGILYADYLVGQIFNQLKEMGIYEDTAIIITSDHGECMGELGIYSEHGTADEATCRIPMIIRWPGKKQGVINEDLWYNLDILPTMSELLGTEKWSHWDGRSYAGVLNGEEHETRQSLVLSQNAHVCQRSARFDDWLYIRTYHDGYHLFEKEMLFQVREDPHEQNNRCKEEPEVCARGAKIILDWQDENMLKDPSIKDPMWTVMSENGPYHTWTDLSEYIARLEQTGREEGADILRKRYLESKKQG